ncbi:MAG: type II secretion system protein, partial [Acidobacteriota bacterium]
IVIAIIGLLAAMVVPTLRFGFRRQKEVELHERIRTITNAIDRYHDLRVKGMIKDTPELTAGEYPKDLDALVKGVETQDGKKVKFIRDRDLIDPMTGQKDWVTRSNSDDFDSTSSDKNNVFDVHSRSTALSLDGKTRYNEW